MYRVFFFFIGILLLSYGLTYIILYSNFLTFGYTIREFIAFIIRKREFIFIVTGLIMISYVILTKKEG